MQALAEATIVLSSIALHEPGFSSSTRKPSPTRAPTLRPTMVPV